MFRYKSIFNLILNKNTIYKYFNLKFVADKFYLCELINIFGAPDTLKPEVWLRMPVKKDILK